MSLEAASGLVCATYCQIFSRSSLAASEILIWGIAISTRIYSLLGASRDLIGERLKFFIGLDGGEAPLLDVVEADEDLFPQSLYSFLSSLEQAQARPDDFIG